MEELQNLHWSDDDMESHSAALPSETSRVPETQLSPAKKNRAEMNESSRIKHVS